MISSIIRKRLNGKNMIFRQGKLFFYSKLLILCLVVQIFPAQGQEIIFQDDFYKMKKSLKKLSCLHGSYDIKNGELILNGKKNGASVKIKEIQPENNYEINCRVKLLPPHNAGHGGFRLAQGKQQIYVYISGKGRFLGIYSNGKTICKVGISIDNKVWNDLKIVYQNNRLTVFVNNKECASISDITSLKGDIFFYCYKLDIAYDDLIIKNAIPFKAEEKENIINNSSFEYSTHPNLPDCWGIGRWGLVDDEWIGKMDELWQRWKRDATNPYHGKYCMRVDGYKRLTSTTFNPKEGKIYTFSAWLRGSSDSTKVNLSFYNWRQEKFSKTVTVGKQWQRVVWTLPPIQSSQCFISFIPQGDNVLWVDAVQLVSGDKPLDYMPDRFSGGEKKINRDVPYIVPVATAVSPVFDGTLNDACWKGAAKMKLVTLNNSVPKEKTEAYLLYDKNNIYIGFRCYDGQMSKVRAKINKRDGHVWNDDCIELFIGPSGPRGDWADYYHLGVSITGAKYDARKDDQSWNRGWQAKTKKFSDHWEAEIILPFKMFDLNKFNQDDWTFNVCRENGKIKELSCWSPTFGSFHKSDNFGILKAFPKNITASWIENISDDKVKAKNFITVPMKIDGKPFIGYGLGWQSGEAIPGENTFKQMKAAGMNLITCNVPLHLFSQEKVENFLNLAHKYRIRIVWWINKEGIPLTLEARTNNTRKVIRTYKKYPAIAAWMVFDEPHSHAEVVKACLKVAKETDTSRPAFINLTPHGLGMRIAGLPGDILCIDQYPIFFNGSIISDLDSLLIQAQKEIKDSPRPLWMFLQGMSSFLWIWRGPTPDEFTAQTYTALVNGVTCIMYFTAIILPTDTWERAGTLAGEIEELTPILLCNEFAEAICGNNRIKFMSRKYNGKIYIIAVNPYNKSLNTDFVLQGKIKSAKRLFENKVTNFEGNTLSTKFEPYERQCYEIQL